MKIRVLVCLGLFLLLSAACSFAAWDKKPELRWTEYFRYDSRHSHDWLYANRISAAFNYLDARQNPLFKLTAFYEARRNLKKGLWERQELGAELGKDIFPWLYVGEGIQKVWLKEAYRQYPANKRRDATESETRLMLSYNLLEKKNIKVKGFVLNECTYDFEMGGGTRNEIAIGFTLPIGKYIEICLDWRHIDRIHYFDSDTFEAQATLVF